MRFATSLNSLATLLILVAAGCARAADGYRVVHAFPHDQQAFTQGLIFVDGHLYESTGIRGQSSLREEDLETGRIVRMQLVPDKYFAEGLTEWKNTLIQLRKPRARDDTSEWWFAQLLVAEEDGRSATITCIRSPSGERTGFRVVFQNPPDSPAWLY